LVFSEPNFIEEKKNVSADTRHRRGWRIIADEMRAF